MYEVDGGIFVHFMPHLKRRKWINGNLLRTYGILWEIIMDITSLDVYNDYNVWISFLHISLLTYISRILSVLVSPASSLYAGAAHFFNLWSNNLRWLKQIKTTKNFPKHSPSRTLFGNCSPINLLNRLRRKRDFEFWICNLIFSSLFHQSNRYENLRRSAS